MTNNIANDQTLHNTFQQTTIDVCASSLCETECQRSIRQYRVTAEFNYYMQQRTL